MWAMDVMAWGHYGATMTSRPKTKAELAARLQEIADRPRGDQEAAHLDADELLLGYINDPAVSAAFWAIEKWYA